MAKAKFSKDELVTLTGQSAGPRKGAQGFMAIGDMSGVPEKDLK